LTYNSFFYVFNLSQGEFLSLLKACKARGLKLFAPKGESAIIETKAHSTEAAAQMDSAGCDAAVLYLGNFSPEIEDNEERR
jgi:hypothetical protein